MRNQALHNPCLTITPVWDWKTSIPPHIGAKGTPLNISRLSNTSFTHLFAGFYSAAARTMIIGRWDHEYMSFGKMLLCNILTQEHDNRTIVALENIPRGETNLIIFDDGAHTTNKDVFCKTLKHQDSYGERCSKTQSLMHSILNHRLEERCRMKYQLIWLPCFFSKLSQYRSFCSNMNLEAHFQHNLLTFYCLKVRLTRRANP